MEPKGVMVTIRGGHELLLAKGKNIPMKLNQCLYNI